MLLTHLFHRKQLGFISFKRFTSKTPNAFPLISLTHDMIGCRTRNGMPTLFLTSYTWQGNCKKKCVIKHQILYYTKYILDGRLYFQAITKNSIRVK